MNRGEPTSQPLATPPSKSTCAEQAPASTVKAQGLAATAEFARYLAGLQIYAQLSLLVFVGAIGSWVTHHWLTITRGAWGAILGALPYVELELSEVQKDCLTAALFFLPSGVLAVIYGVKHDKADWRDPFYRPKAPKSALFHRAVAALCAIVFMWILSRQVVGSIAGLWTIQMFLIPTWLSFFMLFIYAPLVIFVAVARAGFGRLRFHWCEDLSQFLGRIFRALWAAGNWVAVSFLFYAAWVSARTFGVIIVGTALLVFYCVAWTVFWRPDRFNRMAISIGALLILGFLWDAGQAARSFLESLGTT